MPFGLALGRAVMMVVAMIAAPAAVEAAGALAVGECDRDGYSYDYATVDQARRRALVECASMGDRTCHVVSEIVGGCAAFAISGECGPRGWSAASTRSEAEALALNYCRRYGGTNCRVQRWLCDSHN